MHSLLEDKSNLKAEHFSVTVEVFYRLGEQDTNRHSLLSALIWLIHIFLEIWVTKQKKKKSSICIFLARQN